MTFEQATYVERNYIINTKLGLFYFEHMDLISLIFVLVIYLFIFYMYWNLTRGW